VNWDLQNLACRIFKLSSAILFSYVAMCSYVTFHFATRTALTVKKYIKSHSLFSVHARCLGAYFFLPEMR
jgi:hypothetical protein